MFPTDEMTVVSTKAADASQYARKYELDIVLHTDRAKRWGAKEGNKSLHMLTEGARCSKSLEHVKQEV